MNTVIQKRVKNLAKDMSQVIGSLVEITIRGDTKFTFSVDHADQDLECKLMKFFGVFMHLDGETRMDECGTFVYMRVSSIAVA